MEGWSTLQDWAGIHLGTQEVISKTGKDEEEREKGYLTPKRWGRNLHAPLERLMLGHGREKSQTEPMRRTQSMGCWMLCGSQSQSTGQLEPAKECVQRRGYSRQTDPVVFW